MGMVYREIKQAVIDIELMLAILARNPEISDKPDAKPLKVRHGSVRFENVSFAYDPERQILKGLTFEVPAGHTVAVVGPSGGRKSTISRLLFRFYEWSGGRILIDGQDIRDVTQKSLRAALGIVPRIPSVQRYCPLQHPLWTLGTPTTARSSAPRRWHKSMNSSAPRPRVTRPRSENAV